MQILFTDRVLLTIYSIRHMEQILRGKVSLSPYLDQNVWKPTRLFDLDSTLH